MRKSAEFPGTEKNKTTEREDNDVWEKRTIVIVSLAVLAVIAVLALCLNPGAKAGPSLQTTDTVLMVSPVAFGYNEETAVNNAFQEEGDENNIPQKARKEYEETAYSGFRIPEQLVLHP